MQGLPPTSHPALDGISRTQSKAEDWAILSLIYEQEGTRLLESRGNLTTDHERRARLNFSEAFEYLLQISALTHGHLEGNRLFPDEAEERFRGGLEADTVRADLLLAFRLCATGLLGNQIPRMHEELQKSAAIQPYRMADFLFKAFINLVRDRSDAPSIQANQREYLIARTKPSWEIELTRAVGFDHLMDLVSIAAQMVTHTISAVDSHTALRDRHHKARAAFESTPSREILCHVADLIHAGCTRLVALQLST